VTLPRLGAIKTHESTRKLARRLESGTARILSATVSRTAQRWHVSFTVEVERDVPAPRARHGSAAGIDLGVKTLLTGFDSDRAVVAVEGLKPLKTALRKLKRASRERGRRRPLVPVVQNLLGLRDSESQAVPGRAHLPVRLRPGHRPGRERRP
jgi:putative transposase